MKSLVRFPVSMGYFLVSGTRAVGKDVDNQEDGLDDQDRERYLSESVFPDGEIFIPGDQVLAENEPDQRDADQSDRDEGERVEPEDAFGKEVDDKARHKGDQQGSRRRNPDRNAEHQDRKDREHDEGRQMEVIADQDLRNDHQGIDEEEGRLSHCSRASISSRLLLWTTVT